MQRKDFVIFSDAKSVLQSIQNQESKNPIVNEIIVIVEILRRLYKKNIHFCWVPSHVGIPGNEEADTKAKEALSQILEPVHFKIPYTDFIPKVKNYVKNKWQLRWEHQGGRKLKEIMPILKPISLNGMTRKEEVVIHRVRIGHTRLTHSYLMEGRVVPVCHFCNSGDELSIKHLLLYCTNFTHYRKEDLFKNRVMRSIQDLFDNVAFRKILDFLKHTGLFNLL